MADLVSVKIPPGFFRNGTEYEAAGRWYDGSLVRWENGRLKPMGGWRRVLADNATLTGRAREFIAWRANNGFRYAAIGTNSKLYISSGGTYVDLTPDDLVPGREDGIDGPGYGAGGYGQEGYGTRRATDVIALDPATWSLDTWGEDLVGVLSSDGRIFQWQPSVGGDPAVVANAPTNCTAVLATNERYLMALGPNGDRRRVAWCDQEDNTTWAPTDLNTAGSIPLTTKGNIITGQLIGTTPFIWTTTDFHAMDYLGSPLVYDARLVAKNCGITGPKAAMVVDQRAFWMGVAGFFQYDGAVSPLPCDVQDYVFGDINDLQRAKIYAGHNSQKGEITWFYASSASLENDRYVTLNYKNPGGFIWYFGQLSRTCWLDRGVFALPLACDGNGVIWEHDVGFLDDGNSRNGNVFALSGPAEIGSGAQITYSNLMLPDASNGAAIQLHMLTRTAPNGPQSSVGPYAMLPNAEGYTPVRVAGRQVSMRVEQILDQDWSLGNTRFKLAGGGKR